MTQPTRINPFKKIAFVLTLVASIVLTVTGCGVYDGDSLGDYLSDSGQLEPSGPAPVLTFRVVETYPHQTDAFTQGLLYEDGRLLESTGLVGQSSLREVDLETGNVIKQQNLASNLFGEGLASRQGSLFQLTLDSGEAIVWDEETFIPTDTRATLVPAWGLALTDADTFAFSDGTSTIRFLDPITFEEVGYVTATDNGVEVDLLNELEVVNGLIFANRFTKDEIVVIDPADGRVLFRVDLTGLIDKQAYGLGPNDVLNGIAFDTVERRLFVTGKRWPFLYHIELVQ